jgi:hypothetical protein
MTAEQDYPLGFDELPRWRAMCDEINQLRATQHVDREAEIGRLTIANGDLRESARLALLAGEMSDARLARAIALLERARDILGPQAQFRGWITDYDDFNPVKTSPMPDAWKAPVVLQVWPPDEHESKWAVIGDLREVVNFDGESTNYMVEQRLLAEGFPQAAIDPEYSCFYAHVETEAEAIELRDAAMRIAQGLDKNLEKS